MTQYLSPMLVLGFTTERYIAVCHPWRKERLCRTGRARRVVVAMAICCTLLAAIQVMIDYAIMYQKEGLATVATRR